MTREDALLLADGAQIVAFGAKRTRSSSPEQLSAPQVVKVVIVDSEGIHALVPDGSFILVPYELAELPQPPRRILQLVDLMNRNRR